MTADSQMNGLADEYEESISAGRKFVLNNWSLFHQSTKDWLMATECYDYAGRSLEQSDTQSSRKIEHLEYELGTLKLCVDVNLPSRTDIGAHVAGEALKREVPDAAGSMLNPERNHEPQFLRLALNALRTHEMAWLLTRLPAAKKNSTFALSVKFIAGLGGGIVLMIGLFFLPFMLGMGMVYAQKGDAGNAIVWLYGIGITIFVYLWMKSVTKKEELSTDEIAYQGWWRLPYVTGYWLHTGVGASVYLNQMVGKGVLIPPVALDLCAMLTERTTQKS